MSNEGDGLRPSSVALDDAIYEALAGGSSYPDRAVFVDADSPGLGRAISEAHSDGRPVVLCYSDDSRLIVRPGSPAAA